MESFLNWLQFPSDEILEAIVYIAAGLGIGTAFCIGVLMVTLTICAFMGKFVNNPQQDRPSGMHFFTRIQSGQVKIIVRAGLVVRMISRTAGKRFARKGEDHHYWELVDSEKSESPTADIWWPIRWWAWIIYKLTGLVFTGIYPIQRVYEYKLVKTKINRTEDGPINSSNINLEVVPSYSDHFRTRQYLFPVHVTKAETKDKIPLDIIGVAELETVNPHLAAFGTDQWYEAIINLVTDAITSATKLLTLDHVLTAENATDTQRIALAVKGIGADTEECGIQIQTFRVLEINPALDGDGLKAIQSQAISAQRAKGMLIEGQARADNVAAMNRANAAGGEHAALTMQMEGLVRAAEAAGKGGGTVILTPGGSASSVDPIQVASLAALQKIAGSKEHT